VATAGALEGACEVSMAGVLEGTCEVTAACALAVTSAAGLPARSARAAPFSFEPCATAEGSGMRTEPDARLAGRGGRNGLPDAGGAANGLSSPGGTAAFVSLMLESAAIVQVSRDGTANSGHSRE
jgi:hypothetical protein